MGQEAKRTEPVVDRDDDDVAPRCQPVGEVEATIAVGEPAAVDPHHHRTVVVVGARGPHIEGQAVLTGPSAKLHVRTRILDTSRARMGSVTHPLPGRCRGGRLPAQRPDRRCGIRDSREQPVIRRDNAANRARSGLHHRRISRRRRRGPCGDVAAADASGRQQHRQHEREHAPASTVNRCRQHEVRAYRQRPKPGLPYRGLYHIDSELDTRQVSNARSLYEHADDG